MSNAKFYANGIELKYSKYADYSYGWEGLIKYTTQDQKLQGDLKTSIFLDIKSVVDNLISCAEQLGIEFANKSIYAFNNGEPSESLPENWIQAFHEQAQRIGWSTPYWTDSLAERLQRCRESFTEPEIDDYWSNSPL